MASVKRGEVARGTRVILLYFAIACICRILSAQQLETPLAPFSDVIPIGHDITALLGAADFNGDGWNDVIASTPEGLIVFENDSLSASEVSFRPAATLLTASNALPYPADLDGDGRLDVLMAGPQNIYALRNESPPGGISSFSVAAQLLTNNSSAVATLPFTARVVDLDGDGKPEVLSVGPGVTVYLNKSVPGTISFEPSHRSLPIASTNFFLSDLDGDGKPDLTAAAASSHSYNVFLNTSIPGEIRYSAAAGPLIQRSLEADFTGDLKADLHFIDVPFQFNEPPREGTFTLQKNLSSPGKLKFGPSVIGPFPAEGTSLSRPPRPPFLYADWDADGRTDCYTLTRQTWTNTLTIFRSRLLDVQDFLKVEFAPPFTVNLPTTSPILMIADLNSDDRPDMVLKMTNSLGVGIVLNQLVPEPHLDLEIPARTRRSVVGESILVYGTAGPPNTISRLDLLLDGQLVASTNSNSLAALVVADRAGMRRLELRAFGVNAELFAAVTRDILVVEELNIQVRPRELPPQNLSTAAYILDRDNQIYSFEANIGGSVAPGSIPRVQMIPSKLMLPDGVSGWTAMASGHRFAVAIASDGQVYAWGDNLKGQLSLPNVTNTPTPLLIPELAPGSIEKVIAGARHTLALTREGELRAWGDNFYGQLGLGHIDAVSGIQSPLPDSAGWTDIFAGLDSSFALSSEGILYAWGRNDSGQLGLGHTNEANIPVRVVLPDSDKAIHVAAGATHTLILTEQGNLYGCGLNNPLLGLGDAATNLPAVISAPQHISAGRTWRSVSTSGAYNLALDSEGSLFGWGYLQNYTFLFTTNFPTQLSNTNDLIFTQISARITAPLAIGSDGYAYTWGRNYIPDPSDPAALRHFPELICSLDNICPGITNFAPVLVSNFPTNGTILPPTGIYTFEAEAFDVDGFIDSVELFEVIPVGQGPGLPRIPPIPGIPDAGTSNSVARVHQPPFTFALSNVFSGWFFLVARDNSGGQIKSSTTPIHFPRVSTRQIQVIGNPITPQLQWTIAVNSDSPFALAGVGIQITNLPPGVRVLNATSETDTFPILQHSFPVRTGGSVNFTFVLEGPVPIGFIPRAAIQNYRADPLPVIEGPLQSISSIIKHSTTVALELPELPPGDYYIEYSADLRTWYTSPVPHSLLENAPSRWTDTGPPKTFSPPYDGARFYRLRQDSSALKPASE